MRHAAEMGLAEMLYILMDNTARRRYPARMALASAPHIMGTAETRRKLPSILEAFRTAGNTAEPVFIGAYRHVEAVLLPAPLAEKLAPLIEDLLLAERARARAVDASLTISGDDMVQRLGLDESAISAETAALLAMYTDTEK